MPVAALQQRQPLAHLRAEQPVRVGLVVDEGADAGQTRPHPQPGELGGRLVRPVQRYPGHHAGDLRVRRRDLEHGLGVRGGVVRVHQDGPVHAGRGGPARKSSKPNVRLMAAFSGRWSRS